MTLNAKYTFFLLSVHSFEGLPSDLDTESHVAKFQTHYVTENDLQLLILLPHLLSVVRTDVHCPTPS